MKARWITQSTNWECDFFKKQKNSPQRSGSLNYDLFLGVSEPADQRANYIFSL